MTETRDLIETLSAAANPVRRALSPFAAAAVWCGLGVAGAAAAVAVLGPCVFLAARLAEPVYLVWLGATLTTGVCAAVAALSSGQPDRSAHWRLLPLPSAAVTLGAIVARCLTAADVAADTAGTAASRCGAVFLALAGGLAVAMWLLARRAPLRDAWVTAWFAGLAVACLATAGVSLVRTFADPAPLLIWNLAAGAIATAVLAAAWRRSARWRPAAV